MLYINDTKIRNTHTCLHVLWPNWYVFIFLFVWHGGKVSDITFSVMLYNSNNHNINTYTEGECVFM